MVNAGPALDEIVEKNDKVVDRIRDLVLGIIIADGRGTIIQTGYDGTTSVAMVNSLGKSLADLTRSAVRDIDPTNDLKFLRVKTKKCEFLIAAEEEFIIIVSQN